MKLFILSFFIIILISCEKNNVELNINEKGSIKIVNSEKNRYLGYTSFKNENFLNESWVYEIYVYEKFVVYQKNFGEYNVGVSIYKNNKKINYNEYEKQKKLFLSHEYRFIGIYDNYLFLLVIGKSPTYTILKIVNLDNNETIYVGDYIWDIGIKIIEPYIIEIYEYNEIISSRVENGRNIYTYIFDQYLLNIKTNEKMNINKTVEIIGL